VAEADQVVVGRIVSMGAATGDAEANERQQTIILAVEETLKGSPTERLPIQVKYDLWRRLDGEKILCPNCPEHNHRLLATMGHSGGYPQLDITDIDSSNVMDVTGDLQLLPNGAAILRAAREETQRSIDPPGKVRQFEWSPTRTFMVGTPFHQATVLVPVDARQEQLAHKILTTEKAPAGVVGEDSDDRSRAVAVLGFFRTEQNVSLLEALLDDSEVRRYISGELDYPVRIEAYKVLTQWGVKVNRPTLTVKVSEPWDGKIP